MNVPFQSGFPQHLFAENALEATDFFSRDLNDFAVLVSFLRRHMDDREVVDRSKNMPQTFEGRVESLQKNVNLCLGRRERSPAGRMSLFPGTWIHFAHIVHFVHSPAHPPERGVIYPTCKVLRK